MSLVSLPESKWLRALAQRQSKMAELLAKSPEEQHRLGYFHTLREICQQPATWLQTCELMQRWASTLRTNTKGILSLILTGSGSSEYAGDCVRLPLQRELEIVISIGRIAAVIEAALVTEGAALSVEFMRAAKGERAGDDPNQEV